MRSALVDSLVSVWMRPQAGREGMRSQVARLLPQRCEIMRDYARACVIMRDHARCCETWRLLLQRGEALLEPLDLGGALRDRDERPLLE